MRKLIATINMTIDRFCNHTAITPDEEIYQHYADLLSNADAVPYGRITYQLMKYWQNMVKNPQVKNEWTTLLSKDTFLKYLDVFYKY